MRAVVQRLWLGALLLLLCSGVLLYSDRRHRAAGDAGPTSGKRWNVHVLEYVQVLDVEEAEHGLLRGLEKAGLVRDLDYTLTIHNAHGDVATLNSTIDAALTDEADLLITLSTPTVQAVVRRARGMPVVFTYLADPVAAGLGPSDQDHLPNVTGVYTAGAYDEAFKVLRQCLPTVRRVGTLFMPSEVNSVVHKDRTTAAARAMGIEMIALAVSTPTEVPDAAQSLCARRLDAVVQIPGNLTASSFPSIARAAQQARLPVVGFQISAAHAGAALTVARDYEDAAEEAGGVAARVIRGEKPADIPLRCYTATRLIVNLSAARSCNLNVPPGLLERASLVLGR